MTSHPELARPLDSGDEFESYLQEALKDPAYRAGYEDAMRLHGLLDTLVARRKDLGLTQKQVADRMGVRQPAVSGFETESSDPKISTVQRYARAVNAFVRFAVEPAHPGQSFRTSGTSYVPTQTPPPSGAHPTFEATPAQWRDFSRDARTPGKNEYALAS